MDQQANQEIATVVIGFELERKGALPNHAVAARPRASENTSFPRGGYEMST